MRGGRNTGRGRGPGGRQNNIMATDSLVSEHLRDIDLELELLRRKRQIIEQQQILFQPFNIQPGRNYNEQSYSYNENVGQGSSNRDFSQLYDDEPRQNRINFTKKRPLDNDWQQDLYPKKARHHGHSGPSFNQTQRSYASPSQPKKSYANRPVQERRSIGQRNSIQKPPIPVKSSTPAKVNQPTKPPVPLNTIVFQPIPERNRIVAGIPEVKTEIPITVATQPQPEPNSVVVTEQPEAETGIPKREDLRLHPDKEPSKRVRGRLEMTLGSILSDVKKVYANTPHALPLSTMPLQRLIKQIIRDRIRMVMLGKKVGPPKEVVKVYRKSYPRETDEDIINEVIKIARLDKVEEPEHSEEKKSSKHYMRPRDYFKENIRKVLINHFTEMFSKVEEISDESVNSNLSANQIEYTAIKEEITKNEFAEDITIINDEFDQINTNNDNTNDNGETNQDSTPKAQSQRSRLQLTENTYNVLLPRVLRKNIPAVLRMLDSSKSYKKDVADLIATTRTKYTDYIKERYRLGTELSGNLSRISTTLPTAPEPQPVAEVQKKHTLYPFPYYVKLMGKPHLPKRKIMQPFLTKFETKSIKKHRTIHNLLFIGFTDKNQYEAILQANDTVIGKSTLSIRICEKPNEKQDNNTSGNVEDRDNTSTDNFNEICDLSQDNTQTMDMEIDGHVISKGQGHEETINSNLENTKDLDVSENIEQLKEVNSETIQETGNIDTEDQILNEDMDNQQHNSSTDSNIINLDDEEIQEVEMNPVEDGSDTIKDST